MIREKGIDKFLKSEAEKFKCAKCGDIVSIHDGKCYTCGFQGSKPKTSDRMYRWKPNKLKGK